jgi:hypothetical protein
MSDPGDELGILDLLKLRGFDLSSRFKLIRHQQAGIDFHDYLRSGWLQTYQSFQRRPVFHNVDFVVSFIGVAGTHARLAGVYEVTGRRPGNDGDLPDGCPPHWREFDHYYEMRRVPGFEDLERRVIIDWGKGTRRWDQWPTNKPVVEIIRRGQLLKPFDDYLGFTLTHEELNSLIAEPEANAEWRARLSAVAGVYLVLATTTGAQ